jgi:hypothetical protein
VKPRKAVLLTFAVLGTTEIPHDQVVRIVARGVHCFRVECIDDTPVKLAGVGRFMHPGEQAIVPADYIATIH